MVEYETAKRVCEWVFDVLMKCIIYPGYLVFFCFCSGPAIKCFLSILVSKYSDVIYEDGGALFPHACMFSV